MVVHVVYRGAFFFDLLAAAFGLLGLSTTARAGALPPVARRSRSLRQLAKVIERAPPGNPSIVRLAKIFLVVRLRWH